MSRIDVFYIEQEKFLQNMLKTAFNNAGFEFFGEHSELDCLYRIEDLNPKILIIDLDTMGDQIRGFLDEIASNSKVKNIKKIFTYRDKVPEELNIPKGDLFQKPLAPFEFVIEIEKYLGENGSNES